MTPTTLYDEALAWFQTRATDALSAYDQLIDDLVTDGWTYDKWGTARDLHEDWRNARIDWARADKATPCTHTLAERSHEAQRCDWCWMLHTYSRLTQKENDGDDN